MKRHINSFITMCLYALFIYIWISGCSDTNEGTTPSNPDNNALIETDTPDIILNEQAGSVATVSFSSPASWTAELSDTRSIPSWLEHSPNNGQTGKHTLTVKAKEANPGYDDRCAYIRIKAGSLVKIINVIQKKQQAIIAGKEKITLSSEGGAFSIPVANTDGYKVYIPESAARWIHHQPNNKTKGLHQDTENFTVDRNTNTLNREGQIIFQNGTLADTVRIFQSQKNTLILSEKNIGLSAQNKIFTIELQTNTEYDIRIPGTAPWIRKIDTWSSRIDRIMFQIDENTSTISRETNIIFKDIHSPLSDTLFVYQAEAEPVILPQKEWKTTSNGGNIEIPLPSNIDFSIEIPTSINWIHNASSTPPNGKIKLTIDKNQTYDSRIGKIIFRPRVTRASGTPDTLIIRQAQKDAIILVQSDWNIGAAGGNLNLTLQSNVAYGVIIPPAINWVHLLASRGLTTSHLTLSVEQNTKPEKRTAKILFQATTLSFTDTLRLTQEAAGMLVLSRYQQEVEASGANVEVTVTTNLGYTVSIPSTANWITETSAPGVNTRTHKFSITPNTELTTRSADIKFKSQTGDISAIFSVTQKAKAALLPTVTTNSVKYISSSQIQSGGTILSNGGAEITAKGVCWNTSSQPTISNYKTSDGYGSSPFISNIYESTRTKYYLRAYATNSVGTAYGNEIEFTPGSMTDVDGNIYLTVRIGNQEWMAANLRTTRYSNGDPIRKAQSAADWSKQGEVGAYCDYPTPSDNITYGKLYNWYAGKDWRNVCPYGWHVPTSDEMRAMQNAVGSSSGNLLREPGFWNFYSTTIKSTNETGFSARAGGYRNNDKTAGFVGKGLQGSWWTCSKGMINFLTYGMSLEIYYHRNSYDVTHSLETTGKAIRCVKD